MRQVSPLFSTREPMPSRPHPMLLAARDLRKRKTNAEVQIWKVLRDRRLEGVKFRRQHPIGPFVIDFCCPTLRLVIEMDGGMHEEQVKQDRERTRVLGGWDYTVVRFRNEMVSSDRGAVLSEIVRLTEELKRR